MMFMAMAARGELSVLNQYEVADIQKERIDLWNRFQRAIIHDDDAQHPVGHLCLQGWPTQLKRISPKTGHIMNGVLPSGTLALNGFAVCHHMRKVLQ